MVEMVGKSISELVEEVALTWFKDMLSPLEDLPVGTLRPTQDARNGFTDGFSQGRREGSSD
jgi:hypothetical protein